MEADPLPICPNSLYFAVSPLPPTPKSLNLFCLLGRSHKQEREGEAEAPGPEHCGDAACGQLFSGYESVSLKPPADFLEQSHRTPVQPQCSAWECRTTLAFLSPLAFSLCAYLCYSPTFCAHLCQHTPPPRAHLCQHLLSMQCHLRLRGNLSLVQM